MTTLSSWAIPMVIALIVLWGWVNGVNVFEAFLNGARSGIGISFKIIPALVALITAVGVFKASGALDLITQALSPLTSVLGIPPEVVPLALLRPVSGSGAMVIFNDILSRFGPDSMVGRIASVMQGSTETTFYTIAVYYGATSIRRIRHTVPASVTADLIGFIMSAICVNLFFYM